VFSTRDRGVRLRDEIQKQARDAEFLVLDFAEVFSVTYSFADEFVGGLARAACDGSNPPVMIERADPAIAEMIDLSLRKRGIESAKADLVAA
jgi:hypothetical protein